MIRRSYIHGSKSRFSSRRGGPRPEATDSGRGVSLSGGSGDGGSGGGGGGGDPFSASVYYPRETVV